jgi:zinc-finger-containing domain
MFYRGRDYGPVWACLDCDAWVGCHSGTHKPLGRLADKELRQWKMHVHRYFDPIWEARLARKRSADPKYTKAMARGGRYKALSLILGIPQQECHIGMFDVSRCCQAVEAIRAGKLEA